MIIATSISPKNIQRQQRAVSSWVRFGYKIISVNHESEIAQLSQEFPHVDFIVAPKTAYLVYQKHYVYVWDIIDQAFFVGNKIESVFVLNSDIILSEIIDQNNGFDKSLSLLSQLKEEASQSLVCFKRYDIQGDVKTMWKEGNDGFIIHRKFFPMLFDKGFVLGQCFWDWWIPMTFFLNDLQTITYQDIFLTHIMHEREHYTEQWEYNLGLFRKWFLPILGKKDYILAKVIDDAITNNSKIYTNHA